ncbi:MAG: amidohydrolase family protein [Dehalococcoidia bacterium]
MPSTLVRGKYLVVRAGSDAAASTVISDGALLQRDGVIEAVGNYQDLQARYTPDAVIGGANYIVIPGLVNAHHHGRGVTTLQMGTCDDCLESWILTGWGRRSYDHYLMTLYTALQMIESGTTTIMYNHAQTPVSSLEPTIDEILRAFQDSGMRVAFSLYYRNQNRVVYGDDEQFLSGLPADLAQALRQYLGTTEMSFEDYFSIFEGAYRKYGADPSGNVRVLLSPANVQWNSDDFLLQVKEYATRYQTGIHMHLVESFYQKEYGIRTWGKTPLGHLNDLGFLGPELSCAHAVWLTEEDMDLLAQSGATVCHNASSNLRLKNGVAPVNAMVERGVNLAMGTDSTAINDDDDMLQEMRLVTTLHREPSIEAPAINPYQVLSMATANAAAPTFFHDQIGALEPGKRADLVLVNLTAIEEPYLDPEVSPVEALLRRGKIRDVDTVMINGEVVLQNGQFTKVNKAEIVRELKERFAQPVEPEVMQNRQLAQRLLPYVHRFYENWQVGAGTPHYKYNSQT